MGSKNGMLFLILGLTVYSTGLLAVEDPDQRGKEAVEHRQQVELQTFYYGKGHVPQTPMAIELYNEAVKFFEKGEYDLARDAAQESLRLEPKNPLAYEVLGEIENLQQNFEKAETYYKKSFLLDPSPRVKKKLEKLKKEKNIEKDLSTYDEEHFIIKYRQGQEGKNYEGFWLKGMLRETYRMISQDLGYYFNHKTVVLFYNADEFHDVTGQPHWVGGIYDGKIRLPAYQKGFSETQLRAVAAHEMTHAFVGAISGMRAPAWLQEGLAQYEENKVRPIRPLVLSGTGKTKIFLPFNQLLGQTGSFEKNQDPLSIALFYQESFSLVSYLIERYQMYRVKEMLIKYKEGKNTDEIVSEVLGITLQTLEKQWLATVSKK